MQAQALCQIQLIVPRRQQVLPHKEHIQWLWLWSLTVTALTLVTTQSVHSESWWIGAIGCAQRYGSGSLSCVTEAREMQKKTKQCCCFNALRKAVTVLFYALHPHVRIESSALNVLEALEHMPVADLPWRTCSSELKNMTSSRKMVSRAASTWPQMKKNG